MLVFVAILLAVSALVAVLLLRRRRGAGALRAGRPATAATPGRDTPQGTGSAAVGPPLAQPADDPSARSTLVDALHDAVYSTSRDQRILTWNVAAERIYGYPAGEVLGRPVHETLGTEFVTGESADEIHDEIDRAGQLRREVRQRRRDGTVIVLEAHAVAIRDATGAIAGHVFVTRDVSERKHAEAALRRSEAKFRAAFHGAGIAIALLDERGHLLEFNRAFREMLGYSDAELQDRPITALLHPDDLPRAREDFREAVAGRTEVVVGDRRYLRKDGAVVHGFLRSSIIRDDAGTFVYSVGLIEDITKKKAIEAQLMFADRMASMGTLAAGVAHEINNPLSFILANINYVSEELARMEPAPDELLRAVAETREGAIRVREIVRDLKTFSRADDPTADGALDLREVLQTSINLTQNEIRHRARLSVDLGEVPPVEASAHRLGQVFVNLLINAAQAITDAVPERNEIRVRCATRPDGAAMVEVSDTGRGIAPENMARIFEPFFTTKPVGVGTGLGLSICHGIVTRLGGTIDVESQLGHGSTFRVCIPGLLGKRPASATATAGAPTNGPFRARILVVDDEPMVGNAVARTLASAHDVTVASSARAALDHLRREGQTDVVICDLMMPEMTGMDLYEQVAASHPALAARMVFLTGGAFTGRARDFLERVGNPRLEKPFEAEALRGVVRQILAIAS